VKEFLNQLGFDKITAKVWGLGFLERGVVTDSRYHLDSMLFTKPL